MKRIAITIAALAISTSAFAGYAETDENYGFALSHRVSAPADHVVRSTGGAEVRADNIQGLFDYMDESSNSFKF
jgi:hypothetical protein